jgi:hypothetical protein
MRTAELIFNTLRMAFMPESDDLDDSLLGLICFHASGQTPPGSAQALLHRRPDLQVYYEAATLAAAAMPVVAFYLRKSGFYMPELEDPYVPENVPDTPALSEGEKQCVLGNLFGQADFSKIYDEWREG